MVKISETTFIHPRATVHGVGIALGDNVTLWPGSVIRSDGGGSVSLGNNSNLQDGAIVHSGEPKFPVIIGEYVTLAHNAMVHGAEIDDYVCVGISATVLDGCKIESNVILGAGAVAPPKAVLKSGWLYLGSPAKAARELSREELDWLKTNADIYVALGRDNLAGRYDHLPRRD